MGGFHVGDPVIPSRINRPSECCLVVLPWEDVKLLKCDKMNIDHLFSKLALLWVLSHLLQNDNEAEIGSNYNPISTIFLKKKSSTFNSLPKSIYAHHREKISLWRLIIELVIESNVKNHWNMNQWNIHDDIMFLIKSNLIARCWLWLVGVKAVKKRGVPAHCQIYLKRNVQLKKQQ